MPAVVLMLGSNMAGRWGTPEQTILAAVKHLGDACVGKITVSSLYRTPALGYGLQAGYCNMALSGYSNMSPNSLLRMAKSIEREAGRGSGRHWGARPLDVDIIDFHGLLVGWPPPELRQSGSDRGRRARGSLILPHPQAHLRDFVLQPVAQIAPHWFHVGLKLQIKALIAGLPGSQQPRFTGVVRL